MKNNFSLFDVLIITLIFLGAFYFPFVLLDIIRAYMTGQNYHLESNFWIEVGSSAFNNILACFISLTFVKDYGFAIQRSQEVLDDSSSARINWFRWAIQLSLIYSISTLTYSGLEYYFFTAEFANQDPNKVFFFLLYNINNFIRGGALLTLVTILYLLIKRK